MPLLCSLSILDEDNMKVVVPVKYIEINALPKLKAYQVHAGEEEGDYHVELAVDAPGDYTFSILIDGVCVSKLCRSIGMYGVWLLI